MRTPLTKPEPAQRPTPTVRVGSTVWSAYSTSTGTVISINGIGVPIVEFSDGKVWPMPVHLLEVLEY
jgi:hypothetical protein